MKTERFLQEELQKIHLILKEQLNLVSDSGISFEYEQLNIFELLNHVSCEKIFYFKSKYGDFSFLGLGHSETIKARDLNAYLKMYPTRYLCASFLFEEDPLSAEFIMPEWAFVTRNGKTNLQIHKSFEYQNFSTPSLFFNTSFDLNLYDPLIPPWQSYEETPEHDQWSEMINACNLLFEEGELEKIVMSRKKVFGFQDLIEPVAFFKAVMEKNNFANSSYAIFNQISFANAFISLTPEKLFSIEDQTLQTISLAASAPRGATLEEDARFEEMLNSNDKLNREHNMVTEEILKLIKPISLDIEISPLQTMKLPYIQHRSVPIKAKLKPEINAIDLVKLLHPTPAVGGLPWNKAQGKIKELEPTARMHYAAPIGVLSAHYSELAVGIRSALIEENKLTIFGGAGIVKGSLPEDEWIETGIKMNPFLKVVNHE